MRVIGRTLAVTFVAAAGALAVAPLADAATTQTQQSCSGSQVPLAFWDTTVTTQVPTDLLVAQFDPSLGVLNSVALSFSATLPFGEQGYTTANPSGAPYYAYYVQIGQVELTGPGLPAFGGFPLPSLPTVTIPPVAPVSGSASLPALPTGVVGANQGNAYSVTMTSPWTAGSLPANPYVAPGGYSNTTTYSPVVNASVDPTTLSSWTGTGTVDLQAIADGGSSIRATGGNGSNGSSFNPTASVCATYTYVPLGTPLPETPSTVLLPLAGASILGAGFVVRRRRQRSLASRIV